ncbi:hypothetical protein [Chryseobacterium vrystaatense]|uniref:Uncharacterized protein n=1 Tax=Chryseobacterium vrystaatense TaxID=307480 RepID=A0A1M4UD58_9FLAO|nr:hypothetical protein [Chryseobacterium vrystaatense]SHE54513.1 hypothetical protein SAMN02787073_0597 [Chryseobacterium vrystaatense]
MQNIQDLKEKIFFESKNIIDILDKINNVDELLSKQDLVDELANRISFLRLLEKNIEYFVTENPAQNSQNKYVTLNSDEVHESNNDVTEEEAIFNNEFNEIDENEGENYTSASDDEEEKFNHQLDEIVENEFHENIVGFADGDYRQTTTQDIQEGNSGNAVAEDEDVFNQQLKDIEENESFNANEKVFSFIDEERVLADAKPDNDEDLNEDLFIAETTAEEVVFNNQLNEIDEDEDSVSHETVASDDLKEKGADDKTADHTKEPTERIPSIFDTETLEDEILIEESEEQFIASNVTIEQGEMLTDTSNVEGILSEIKNDFPLEEREDSILAEVYDRRKIVDIDKPSNETEKHPSDESFEDLDAYQQEKKIKLANIKGLKAVQTLFDDDPLERETPQQKPLPEVKEDNGGILKTNIPTNFMEADKVKPEFRLDLNDRIAFSKMLFDGSQSDLNETVARLNGFRNLEEAKEYLSDLYYERKWSKVDEYAQRLWILVENKFL